MNILFLSIGNVQSIDNGGIYPDLLRKFKENGHNIFIVSPSERREKNKTQLNVLNGVHYLTVKTGNITKVNLIEKGISTLLIERQFLTAIKKYYSNITFDLILYTTPPITFDRVIKYIKKRDNANTYLLLKDIFPQNAVDLNMFSKKSLLYKYFRRKEKKLYHNSDVIGCMSAGNVEYVLKHNREVSKDKVEICPNSIEVNYVDIEDSKSIREKYNIPTDKTVFVYGGNLGKPQGIDFIIECLIENKENENVHFLIVGSGTEFNRLQTAIINNGLENTTILSSLPKQDYERLANSCDVGLIFLDYRFTIPNYPSRLLSYLQASMPVLAATDESTDVKVTINRGDFGYWVPSNDVQEFTKAVSKLTDKQLRNKLGNNARNYLENNYTSKHSYDIIMKHFK